MLEDSGRTALGLAIGLSVTRDGGFLISDSQRGTLVEFARDGGRVREIGRRGEGPGEWSSGPYQSFRFDDSTFVVSDGGILKAVRPPRADAIWMRQQSAMSTAFSASDGVVYRRAIDRERRSTIARYRGASDSVEYGGPYPAPLGRSQMLDLMLIHVNATPIGGDSIAAFVVGNDNIFVGPFAGPFDSVPLPIVTRRGARRELLDAVSDDDPESGMRAAYKASWPALLGQLPSRDHIAIVTADQEFLGNRVASDLNVAVLNITSRRFCGERRLPVARDPQSWPALRGDTLFVFSHEADSLAGDATPTVRRFVLEAQGC